MPLIKSKPTEYVTDNSSVLTDNSVSVPIHKEPVDPRAQGMREGNALTNAATLVASWNIAQYVEQPTLDAVEAETIKRVLSVRKKLLEGTAH